MFRLLERVFIVSRNKILESIIDILFVFVLLVWSIWSNEARQAVGALYQYFKEWRSHE